MHDILIPFAKHTPTGKHVFIDDVPSGLACECECLGCGERLVARKGNKQHHFAHHAKKVNDEESCPFSFDRAIFWMWREVFRTATFFSTPAYQLKLEHRLVNQKFEVLVTQANKIAIDEVIFQDDPLNTYKKDLIILKVKDHHIAVSISEDKPSISSWPNKQAFKYKGKEIAHIQIDLDVANKAIRQQKKRFRNVMKDILLEGIDAKTWLYHPREEKHRDSYESIIYKNIKKEEELEKQAQKQKAIEEKRRAIQEKRRAIQEKQRALEVARQREAQQREEKARRWQTEKNHEKRLEELLEQLNSFKDLGHTQGKVCMRCYFISEVDKDHCAFCQHTEFKRVDLTDNYFYYVDKKYDQWGYVRNSIAGLPPLQIDDIDNVDDDPIDS